MRAPLTSRLVVLLLAVTGGVALVAQSPTTPADRLRAHIERAIEGARGRVGVAITHLESGSSVQVNADEGYPMASTFKLPILVELYAQERAGRIRLDEMVELKPSDQHLGSGDISVNFDLPGVTMSLRNVANMMMMISDNSATDLLLARLGADNVTARMKALGLTGIRVDRSCQELILDYGGHDTPKLKGLLLQELRPLLRRPPGTERVLADRDAALVADARDQAAPRDMTRLLVMLGEGRVVDAEASAAMLELMKRCRTGTARLKGLLPRDTVVAHKTGTIGGTVNDVGIIYLPDGAGRVAISVMAKGTRAESDDVERAIAEVARYAYDYFLFSSTQGTGSKN